MDWIFVTDLCNTFIFYIQTFQDDLKICNSGLQRLFRCDSFSVTWNNSWCSSNSVWTIYCSFILSHLAYFSSEDWADVSYLLWKLISTSGSLCTTGFCWKLILTCNVFSPNCVTLEISLLYKCLGLKYMYFFFELNENFQPSWFIDRPSRRLHSPAHW